MENGLKEVIEVPVEVQVVPPEPESGLITWGNLGIVVVVAAVLYGIKKTCCKK